MVACPCVVVVALDDAHTAHLVVAQAILKQLAHTLGVLGSDDKRLVLCHSLCYLHEGFGYVVEIRKPVGFLMRPRKLHTRLAMPLGRKNVLVDCHIIVYSFKTLSRYICKITTKNPKRNTIPHISTKLIGYFRAYINKKQYFCSPKGRTMSFGMT